LVDRKCFDFNGLQWFGISQFEIGMVEIFEGSMEGKHPVITRSLTIQDQVIHIHMLIDCWAAGIAFMNEQFA